MADGREATATMDDLIGRVQRDAPGTLDIYNEMAALLADYARQSSGVATPTPRSLIARTRAVLDKAGVNWAAR